jgi:hypothetical protein
VLSRAIVPVDRPAVGTTLYDGAWPGVLWAGCMIAEVVPMVGVSGARPCRRPLHPAPSRHPGDVDAERDCA